MTALRVGTRASALALAQARWVAERLDGAEIVEIVTSGDRARGVGDKSRWVDTIEAALVAGEIDLAVHSAKDVPGELAEGCAIVAAPPRAAPEDVLVGAPALAALPTGARVGTSALRRRAQLLAVRPDLDVVELRGNVDTRLRRLAAGELDAVVLARAGLDRLERARGDTVLLAPGDERPCAVLGDAPFVPAPGQGTLALEARAGDERFAALADPAAGTNPLPLRAPPASPRRPRRSRPAAASTSTSTSPAACLRSRVSTFPRSSTTSRSGRSASSCARRRSALVPTRAPSRTCVSRGSPTSTSAASARRGAATIAVPVASSPGTSLAECTAISIAPAVSAASSAPTQRDLSPRPRSTSPAVVIGTISLAAPSSRATARACASASVLPRVPIRSAAAVKAGAASGPRRAAPPPRPRPARRARTARAGSAGARGGGRRRAP